ncbi:hypothetical protein [Streptomyces sp. Y1]|uniref:Uncharacterized protein n=1 Tax=Streptomyces sp. Y1 TaxID=3238634 RepID=A0AB39TV45_9ACTN
MLPRTSFGSTPASVPTRSSADIGIPSDTEFAALPDDYAPAVRGIRAAVESGDHARAARSADDLLRQVSMDRGSLHPAALRALEVRAHVAVCCSAYEQAAELYSAAAAGWAGRGSPSRLPAARNADLCRLLAADAAAVRGPIRVASAPRRRARAERFPLRRSLTPVVLTAMLIVGSAFTGDERRADSATFQTVSSPGTPTAPVLIAALDHARERTAPTLPSPPAPSAVPASPSVAPDVATDPTDDTASEDLGAAPRSHTHPVPAPRPRTPEQQHQDPAAPPSAPSRVTPPLRQGDALPDALRTGRLTRLCADLQARVGRLPDTMRELCHGAQEG